jgi:hypothetical protein
MKMRTLTKILMVAALAMTVSSSAGAIVTVSLTQIGGTYNGISAVAGDTLVLQVDYAITGGTMVSIIDPLVAFGAEAAFNSGTETGPALWEGGLASFAPLNAGFQLVSGGVDGLEKATTFAGGVGTPGSCIFDANPGGSCGTLGTLSFTLSGLAGVLDLGAIVQPTPFGTIIADGAGNDITAGQSLGTFSIIPEPTTASLLGLGLLGLTLAGRRRKN